MARAFMAVHQLPDVTVVADAGMVSEANRKEIEVAGLSFILDQRIPDVPWLVAEWQREHPGEPIPDGHVFTQRWPVGPIGDRCDQVIYYQYRHDRARRTLRGIDEQVKKAENAIAGRALPKRRMAMASNQVEALPPEVCKTTPFHAMAPPDLPGRHRSS